MNRQTNHFGFGQMSRPSGIRPPISYGMNNQNRMRSGSTTNMSSVPTSTSSRKGNNMSGLNFPGSVGSRSSAGSRQSVYGNFRTNPFSSARKSMTAKLGPLFGLTPQHNRQSYQPNTASSAQSSNRRSSIGGNRYIKDSRPLSDSSYQRQCVGKLIAFLTDNPIAVYPHPISKTLGTRPTVAEITKIFEFLFICFGIKSKITPIEVEIPKIMAAIEYPFTVKKSDLVSFTSGRALGSVLGMLEWLVDSLTYLHNMDPIRTFYPNFEGEIDTKTELISLCLRANAEEIEGEQIEDQLKQLIVKTYGTENDYAQLVDEQEALEQELIRLDEEIQQTKELPNSVQTYKSDITNYDQYMNEMKAHYKTNEEILENLQKDFEEKLNERERLKNVIKQLKIKVGEQEFGIEEAVVARERKQQLEDEIKQELTIIEDIKKSIRNSRLECSKYEDIIKKMHSDLDSFVAAMTDLVDSPVMCNYSSTLREILANKDWVYILDELKDINNRNGSDIIELGKLFSKRVNELKRAIVKQSSSLTGCVALAEQHKLKELNLMIEENEKQIKQNEELIKQINSDSDKKTKEHISQISAMESQVNGMRQMLTQFNESTQSEEMENIIELRKQVSEKEESIKSEEKVKIKEFEDLIITNSKGYEDFSKSLDSTIAKEEELTRKMKAFLSKF